MKKIFFFFSFLILFQAGKAETVSLENAKIFARNYLNVIQSNSVSKQKMNGDVVWVQTENALFRNSTEPSYFIFNRAGGQGFVIISGDDAVKPIIGYSDENAIDPNNMPENFKVYMEKIKEQIAYVKTHRLKATDEIKNEWRLLNTTGSVRTPVVIVPPLVKSRWNQGQYYNALCPGGTPTGCVATAMAQIMRYWNYPNVGTGSHSYNAPPYGIQSANFGATTYNWSAMPDQVYSSNSAVATLMYHCGVAVDMEYSPSGSGAWVNQYPWTQGQTVNHPICAETALRNYFGYSSVQGKSPIVYNTNDWLVQIRLELNNRRPMLYSGGNATTAHAWVMDGYDNASMFHMNWGWGGSYDGYFAIWAMNPGSYQFNDNTGVLIGIEKPNRLALSSISGPAAICGYQSVLYTINGPAAFSSYLVTAPAGWLVHGTTSTGAPISVSNPFAITPPSSTYTGGGVVSVTGVTSYGETTRPVSITISIGKGSETFDYEFTPGFSENNWTASPGSYLESSSNNSTWTYRGQYYSRTVKYPATATVYIRTVNDCGTSASHQYNLYADPFRRTASLNQNNEMENKEEVTIFPNPVADVATVKVIIDRQKALNVSVYNSLGELVYTKKENDLSEGENNIYIETSNFTNGIYNMIINSNEGSVSKAFVVNK